LASFYQDRYPGLELFFRNGHEWRFPENASITAPPPGHAETAGLLRKAGQSYLWAHARRGSAVAVAMAPLTREALNGLVPNLGDVSLLKMTASGGSVAPAETRPVTSSTPSQVRRIPPAANWLDAEVLWFNVIPVPLWESPGATENFLLVVTSRPSAVLGTLFGPQVDWTQGTNAWAFLVTAGLFLVVELVALGIGISLTRTITGAVHELHEGTQRVTQGSFSHRIPVRGSDQLADLGVSFNRMTENLERLLRVEKEKERLQSEVEIASEVQNQLYPKSVPSMPRLELKAYCSPARMVSGDYYDYLALTGAKVALAIGDVSGKGISAALLMATVQSCLRTQIRACLEGATGDGAVEPARLVTQLNQQLVDYTPVEKFATFYFGVYDDDTGLLSYTNAGHPPPIVVRNGEVLRLETNGMVVGAFLFAEYEESRISLQPGDLLVCFTDGITEPENEYGEMFGEDRLADLIVKHSQSRPHEVVETVFAAVRQWSCTAEAQDDMTMLVARRL
jgi:sigma-B regulation protein RsbU (phosphoserine phosphatase)